MSWNLLSLFAGVERLNYKACRHLDLLVICSSCTVMKLILHPTPFPPETAKVCLAIKTGIAKVSIRLD